MRDTMLLFSGGRDSIVAAAMLSRAGSLAGLYLFNYGQQAYEHQLSLAEMYAERFGVPLLTDEFNYPKKCPPSAKAGMFIKGFKPETEFTREEMAETVTTPEDFGYIEGRNMLIFTTASIRATYHNCLKLAVGFQINDAEVRHNVDAETGVIADNTHEFLLKMQALINQSFMGNPLMLYAPLFGMNKEQVLQLGRSFGIEFQGDTNWPYYSCEFYPACGKCSQCLDAE